MVFFHTLFSCPGLFTTIFIASLSVTHSEKLSPLRMRFFDRAALFAEACLEYGLLPADDSSVCILLIKH